jgi:predicted double-glycine peptidase
MTGTNGQATKPATMDSLQEDVRRLELSLQKQLLESTAVTIDNQFVDPLEFLWDDQSFWLPLGYSDSVPWTLDHQKKGELLPVYITEYGLKVIRDLSRRLCYFNEFAVNALENRVSYIVGSGMTYSACKARDDCPDELLELVQDVLDHFIEANEWGDAEAEIVRRCDRDGEAFVRFFPQMDGTTIVRFIEPEHVKTPPGHSAQTLDYNYGIETDRLDVESVHAYWVVDDPLSGMANDRVDAADILHLRLNVDRAAKRGLPTFFPVRKNFERADKLLRNMSLMAQVQATFAMIRKYKGYSAASVQAANASDTDFTVNSIGGARNFRRYAPGTVMDVPEGVDYEFPAGNVNAGNFVTILQAELRAIASRLNMPEFMLSADASNANYSSTMIAESPAVKNFQRLQHYYRRKFGHGSFRRRLEPRHRPAMWRVIYHAVCAGRLPRETLSFVELKTECPSLIVRDQLQEAQRKQILSMNGILSKQTWSGQEGLDYEQEQQEIEDHNERVGDSQGSMLPLPTRPGDDQPASKPQLAQPRTESVTEGWVTIGAKKAKGAKKKKGGTHVELGAGGKITKGPSGLMGKHPGELGKKGKKKGDKGGGHASQSSSGASSGIGLGDIVKGALQVTTGKTDLAAGRGVAWDQQQQGDGPTKVLDVPDRRQDTNYSCGAAALQAVLAYFGIHGKEQEIASALGTDPETGTGPEAIIALAGRLGLKANVAHHMTIDELQYLLDLGRPVLCPIQAHGSRSEVESGRAGHYVAVIGYSNHRLFIQDPASGRIALHKRLFDQNWHDQDGDGQPYDHYGIALWK